MKHPVKPNKELQSPKQTGRYTTPEEAALAKNANLINHIKKLGLTVEELKSSSK